MSEGSADEFEEITDWESEDVVEKLKDMVLSRNDQLAELQNHLQTAAQFGKSLLEENSTLKEQLHDLEVEMNGLRHSSEVTSPVIQKKRSMATVSVSVEQAENQGLIESLQHQLTELEAQNRGLYHRAEELEQNLEERERELGKVQTLADTIPHLKGALEKTEEELKEKESLVASLRSSEEQLKKQKQELSKLNAELEARSGKAEEAEEEKATLSGQLETLFNQLKTVTGQRDELDMENARLKTSVNKLVQVNEELNTRYEESQTLLEDVSRSANELRQAMEESMLYNERKPNDNGGLQEEEFQQVLQENAKKEEIMKMLWGKLNAAEARLGHKKAEMDQLAAQLKENQERQKEGYLLKQGTVLRTWRKFFFFIEGDNMYYAPNPHVPFSGFVPLRGAWVEMDHSQGLPFCFRMKTRDDRSFFFQARDEADMVDWIVVIKKRIQKAGTMLEEVKEIVKEILTDCTEETVFQDDNYFVTKLCFLLERALSFGLKSVNFFSATTMWDFFQKLTQVMARTGEKLETVKSFAKRDVGRGRVFLRLALNEKTLVDYLKALSADHGLVERYYEEFALIRNKESFQMFLMLLENFRVVNFALFLKDPSLDDGAYWENLRWDRLSNHHNKAKEKIEVEPDLPSAVSSQLEILQKMEKL